jgi:UDP-N-acetylenolpyruvoylglucosamine reductase
MAKLFLDQLRTIIPTVEEHVSLQQPWTLNTGGVCDLAITVASLVELVRVVQVAQEYGVAHHVVGQGTHTLWSDSGFPGLLIRNHTTGVIVHAEQSLAVAESGVLLRNLVTTAAGSGLGGLVPFFSSRGTVGSAVLRDETIDGVRILNHVRNVTVLHPPTKIKPEPSIIRHPAKWLIDPVVRNRFLPNPAKEATTTRPVLLSVTLQLTHNHTPELFHRIKRLPASLPATTFGPVLDPSLRAVAKQSTLPSMLAWDKTGTGFVRKGKGLVSAQDLLGALGLLEEEVAVREGIRLARSHIAAGVW